MFADPEPLAAAPIATQPAPLRQLGDYELLAEIARGGMGIVYRARQRGLNRQVAVKLMRDSALARPEDVKRFRAEAASAAKLRHPHIIAIHDVGEEGGQHYFAMDLVEGVNLADRTREGPLPAREAAELVAQIADAVQHAHEQGVLHRDLKPSNVLVDAAGKAFVTDFGLSRPLDADSSLTVTGQVLGTPGYMPPEQATGKGTVGPAADLYSLGALLYHLLTGRAPFAAANVGETLRQVIEQEPVSPQLLNAAVPRDLTSVCLKCLAKRPLERYASASALAEDLRRFLRGEPTLARPAGQTERLVRWARRKPALATAFACVALVAIVGFAGITWQWQRAERQRAIAERNELEARQNAYAADMLAVQQFLTQGDAGSAGDLLLSYAPKEGAKEQSDLRGWEWWYYAKQCLDASGRPQPADSDPVVVEPNRSDPVPSRASSEFGMYSIPVFGPDGRTIAFGNARGGVDLWDLESNTVKAHLPAEPNPVGFTADGGRLITATVATALPLAPAAFAGLKFWDVVSGSQNPVRVVSFPATNLVVGAAKLSSDGTLLATGDLEGNVLLWNARDGTVVKRAAVGTGQIWNLVFSPTETVLGVAFEGGARLWNWSTDERISIAGSLAAIDFSPDGQTVATGFYSWVRLWRTSTGEELDAFQGGANIDYLVFSKDGRTLATAGGSVKLWHVATRRQMARFLQGSGALIVAFSSDGKRLLGGKVGAGHVWTTAGPDELGRLIESAPAQPRSRIPARDPDAPRELIDLSSHYNASLTENWGGSPGPEANDLSELPPGVQTLGGVRFDLRGLIHVGNNRGSRTAVEGHVFPRRVPGIAVGLPCQRLHFLHAATWGIDKPGTTIGSYVVHFADGRSTEIPIVLGKDLADWWTSASEAPVDTTVAWTGTNPATRARRLQVSLFRTTWKNPTPAVKIETIDFNWSGTKAMPFLVAITAE